MNNESQQSVNCKNHIIMYLIVLIVLMTSGFLVGLYFGGIGLISLFPSRVEQEAVVVENIEGTYEEGYNDALEFARNRIENKGYITDEPQYSIIGTIESLDQNEIVFMYNASDLDLFNDSFNTKTILLNEKTIIESEVAVPEEEIEARMIEYQRAYDEYRDYLANNSEEGAPEPPEPPSFSTELLSINDLKVGDSILIETKNDLREIDDLYAVKIQLLLNQDIGDQTPDPDVIQ